MNLVATQLSGLRLKSEVSTLSVLANAILWLILSVVTFGLAMMVFPYYIQRYVLNRTYVYNAKEQLVGRLECDINLVDMILNLLLWFVLSVITFGILYIVFIYKMNAHCLNKTRLVPAIAQT